MEEKQREQKRARTTRSDYLADVDEVQAWIQQAELKVQNRSIEPAILREHLRQIQNELGTISDKLERLTKNGQTIVKNTKDDAEKELINNTIGNLTEQLAQVRSWLEEKKQIVGDTLDAWQRFLTLYEDVKAWTEEKKQFLVEPLKLSTLVQSRQRLHEYSTAVKSCKQVNKNLSDMGRELENIGQVTSVGDLPEKLTEAEEGKVQVEGQLLERNALLQEASEEWEQCERKMKDARNWMEKTRQTLESPQNKKKSLRDQHAIREKMLSDIAIQKTKITISVEKLEVHFRSGIGGDNRVRNSADDLIAELNALHNTVKEQTSSLEVCLAQIDQYQQEIQQLRQCIVQTEQQLRTVLSPTYMTNDREKAFQEQQSLQKRMEDWKQRSKTLLDQIYAVDPYYVSSNEYRFIGQASYADIAAGRTSPSSRNCSPYRQQRDVTPSTTATQVLQSALTRVQKSTVECLPLNEAQVPKTQIQESDLDKPKTQAQTKMQVQCVQTVDDQAIIGVEENQQDIPEVLVESPVTHRGRSPTRKINSSNAKDPKAMVIQEEEPDRYDNRRFRVTPRQETRAESTRNTLVLHQEQKGRSPSPMWVPGSASYADILRGCIQTTQINIAFAEPSRQEMVPLSGESPRGRTQSPCTEQVPASFTMNVDESQEITEASQVASMQETQVEDIQIAEAYCQSPEISAVKVEEQSYAESGPSNWADKHLEGMLQHVKPYENLPRQSVTETVQSTEIYDYMVPEPMPKLIGFIGSQLGTYPMSSYVYASSGHQQVQELDTTNLNPYNNSSLTYTPEHYVVPTAYLSASDIYQQTPMQQQCPVNDTRHEIPMLVEKPVEVPVARQEVSKDAIITESIDESKQKEPVNVSETSMITKTEGRDALNDIETKGQIFSYAQILSQGLNPRITSTHVINKQDVINQSPTADQQNKEQSSLTFRELSPLQEPKYEQDSHSIPKSKQFRQSKKNDWDMIKKREIKKRQSNDKTEQIDEKKSRKLVDKPMEKQNKEKLSPPKQLEIRDESNIISDSSENKKREEKPEQQEKQIDCKDMNLSQEKKRKQKKKKVDKSVGDEIDKALKEIEDMDKQKVKSQREKLKEQIEEQNKSQNSANETLGKSKDEANKKQGKFGETSIKSGKSKKITKIKENVLLEQAALQNQINARDQCILKDNAENKEDTKNVKVLNSKGEEKVQKNISNNMLKDQSQIDNDIHINSDKPDIKTKHKNKTDKNNTKDKEQREKSSENKVQGQSDILSDKRIDKINVVDESSITEITKLPVAGKIELEKEKSNIVEIESTKGQKDASKKEKNKTKSKKSKLNAESNNKNQEKLGNDKEIINDKYLESVEPVIDTEMKNSKSKALDTAEIVNKVNSNAKDKTNPKKKDKTSKSKMKSEVAIDHTLSVIPTSKVLDETKINLNDTEIKESNNQEINVPKSEQIIEAKIAETAVIANFKKIQSEEIVLPPNIVPQTQDIKQTDITCKNDKIYYDRHEAKELTENKKLEHYQANTKLGAENLIRESSETADMMDEKKAIDSHIEIIEKTEKRETEKHQMKTGKSKKLQKAKFNVQDKNKMRKDNIKTPQLVESENKSVGKEDELNTESLSKPLSASTIENFVPDQYIEKTNETEHALVPDNSCLVQSKTDTENNLNLKIDERKNATLGQVNKHVPSLSKSKKKDKSKGKTVKPVISIKEDIYNEPMEFIKDADKPEAVSTLSTKVTIPRKELTVSTPSENLTEIVSATETIPVISESSPEVDKMNVKEKDQIVEKEKFDHHKQKPIIEDDKDIKTDVIEDFPVNDEKDVTSEDVTSKKIISKCTKKKKTLFPKHITEQTKHSSSFYDKFQEKIVFKDNLIKEKEISEPVICPKQRLGKNPSSPTKINNIETEEAQETKKQLLKNAEAEAKFDSEISSDSVGEAKIHEKHKENIHNLESELPSTGKALIIEKTVTTVTTTSTSIPGSIKVDKPADIKSIKSVEILENIPLPKIVGSKVTELITLRPETVEASLTTTYARVGNDFPVCSPMQSDQATNSQRIGLISASSTENIMTSNESAPFDNMRNRRGISPGISGKFNDTPTAIIALEGEKRELVAHSDDNMERQEKSILLNEFTINQEDPRQSNIKVSEGKPETDNTKEEETFSVDIISQNDNIIKNQDINNSVETDNITEIDKIDQVVSYIPDIKKEELEENKVEESKVNVEITQNVQEETADEQTEIETKCGNNPTTNKIKSENIPENVKTKKQIVPNYLLDVIKPYAMDRHAYNNAESNFYRNFKIIKIVKELQPPAAVIQTKSESIEEIIQGSVMKPKSTNREMSEINSRRHALIMETPKYPIISFYEIESQWIKNKSISEKSMSISTDNSDSRNSAVEEKIEQTIEEKMTIDAVSAEEILQQETLVNSTANNISLTDITEDLNSSRDLNSSDSISQAISKVTELNASIASPVEKISDNQLVDTGAITDTNIQIEESVAKNDIKTEQELLEIKTAPIVKSSINLESDDAWIALLEEEIILDDDFDDPETQTVTYVDDQIEKREEIEKKKLIIETDIEKIEKEAEIEKPEEEFEKKEIIEKQEEKIEKRETMIEEREENIEREKAKIETLDNATLMEIAVKDEYHTGIKDIQNDILYVDSKKQSDKMKNQPKKKKESKHIKDTKAKDYTKIKAGSKKQSDVEIKTNATESLLPTQSNLEKHRTLKKITEPETDKIEKSLIADEEQSESSKDDAKFVLNESTLKQKAQDITIDEAYEKPSLKFKEHKSKSSKKSKKQIEKSAIVFREKSATSKHQDNTKEDQNNVLSITTEIKSNVLGAPSIVEKQQESTENNMSKYDSPLNSNAKSWATIVGTKDVTETIVLEDDSLNTQTSAIICQDTINSARNIVEQPQASVVHDSCEIPPKQDMHSSSLENQTSKDIIEESRATVTDEIVNPIAEKSIESKKQLKEGNKSYAQVAASSRQTFPQASQEKICAVLDTRIIEPILLKPDHKVNNAKILTSDELHENLNTEKLLEQDKQVEKIIVHQSADQKTDIEKPIFQNESIPWIEEIEEETSTLPSICVNPKDDETYTKQLETNTWAAIVGKKSIESPEVNNVPSLEQNLPKQIAEQRPLTQVQIYVEETLEQEPIGNLIQVDEQGFMEFVNRKELRSRRSRSRSRSAKRNDGHAIVETSDWDKKMKTSNIESENVKTKKKIEDKNKEPTQRHENEQKIIDVERDELAKIIKKDVMQELAKPSEKINASKNKSTVKQQKDSNKRKKENEKQPTESKTQNTESKIIQEIKPEQGETFEDRKSKSEKNKSSKDQTKQQTEVNEQKELTHIGQLKEEQKFVNKTEISNKFQSKNIESQKTKNIEDQSIKETQLIEDINVQENKCKNEETILVTEQSNATKSKKKSKNKRAKVITEQLIENIYVSDISKEAVITGKLEEKKELLAEPKLDDEVKIKLEEAITGDITHNKSTNSENEEIPAEEANKQEDIKQEDIKQRAMTCEETTEQESIEQNLIVDEPKNTKMCEKSHIKQVEENIMEQKEISKVTKAEKRRQKKKARSLLQNEKSEKKGFEMEEDVAQNKSLDLFGNTNIIEDIKTEKTVEITEEVANIAPLKDTMDVVSVKENDKSITEIQTAQIETIEKSLEKAEAVIENKTLPSQINPIKDKEKHKNKAKSKKEKRLNKTKSQEFIKTFTTNSTESEIPLTENTEIINISKDVICDITQTKEGDVKKLDNEPTKILQFTKDIINKNDSSVTSEITKEENIKKSELLASSIGKEIAEIKNPLPSEKKDKHEQKSLKIHDAKIEGKQESQKQEDLSKCPKEDVTGIMDENVSTINKLIDVTTKETVLKTESSFDYSVEKKENILIETKLEENFETSTEETKEEIKHEQETCEEYIKTLEKNNAAELTVDSEKIKTITENEQIIDQKEKLVKPEEAASGYNITLAMADTKQTELPQIEKLHPKPDDTLELYDITIVNNDVTKIKSITDNIETNKSNEIRIGSNLINNIHTPTELSSDLINIDTKHSLSLGELSSAAQHLFEDEDNLKHEASIVQETLDVSIEPIKPKVQFYIADEILVLSSDQRKNVSSASILQEQPTSKLCNSRYLSIDHGFWLDKRSYHEAERDHFENLAVRMKKRLSRGNERNSDDRHRPRDHDDDRDGDNSGGRSQDPCGNSRFLSGAPQTERMIADLPGGICSWRDYSTYLSNESERTPDHSLSLGSINNQAGDSDLLLDYSLPNDARSLDHLLTSPSSHDPRTESRTESLVDTSEVNPKSPATSSSSSFQSSDPSTCIQSSTFAHLRPQSKLHLGKETWQGSARRCSSDEEVERETTEDKIEKRIRRIQDTVEEDLASLQTKLSNFEETMGYLPLDNIESMLSSVTTMLTELRTYDEEVTQLEKRLREIPADIESQRLLVALTEIHTRVTSLINEAKQGQIALEQAQEGREKRGQEIHTYKLFLEETETWLKNIVSKIDEQHSFNTNKILQEELSSRANQVSEYESLPEVSALAIALKKALVNAISQLSQKQQVFNVFQSLGAFANITLFGASIA